MRLPSTAGEPITLSGLGGPLAVLYLYPMTARPGVPLPDDWDLIPGARGCTPEACSFRDHFAEFKEKGAVVLGVSTDKAKSHDKFVEKYKLPFTLVVDEDKKIVKAYGVWGYKTFMGMNFLGTSRITFLIGPDGRIKKIWPKVKVAEHAEEILAEL